MGKKSRKKRIEQKVAAEPTNAQESKIKTNDKTEKVFKRILKSMSWTVGICFVLIIILPEFNNRTLDRITQVLYYIGIINLLLFTLIELIADSVKRILSRWIG
jgi:putative ribosome biogenesis GTPase RsgA